MLLEYCAQRFEPGVHYPEVEVNDRLRELHDDYAMLRRYLVDRARSTSDQAGSAADVHPVRWWPDRDVMQVRLAAQQKAVAAHGGSGEVGVGHASP